METEREEMNEAAADERRTDDISKGYEAILERLREAEEQSAFWGDTIGHHLMVDFRKELRADMARERESWDDIKPAEFRDSQAGVKARRHLLDRLEQRGDDARASLHSIKMQRASYYLGNEMLLKPLGYTMDQAEIDESRDDPAVAELFAENDPGAPEEEIEADGQNTIKIAFAAAPNGAVKKKLKKLIFETVEGDISGTRFVAFKNDERLEWARTLENCAVTVE